MNRANSPFWRTSAAVCALGLVATPISAQITPDATLPNNSVVLPNGNVLTIEGGTEARNNLFHSFEEFSIPTGREAFFNNALTIDNIITRVTGGNLSDIDGLIRANGTANLFLINPNGIQFGPNASLEIGGSFLGSTAESLLFEDGSFYSATEPNASPLLSVNVPVGLQWNQTTPTATTLQGTTLNVANGETLSLLGGNVTLTGSTLNAPGGRVELGGLSAPGTVRLNGLANGFQGLSFPEGVSRSDVSLSDGSAVNVAGGGNGNIGVNARNLTLSGSELQGGLGEGLGSADSVAGNLSIDVTGNTTLGGRSSIANDVETGAIGNGGQIELITGSLTLTGGSRIQTVTNSTGTSGEIVVNANGVIEISGFTDDGLFSGILSRSATQTSGTGGNITINNPQNALTLSNRGFIGAVTNSSSDGGTIETNLNTLTLETGGQIVTATTNAGHAGDITINAAERVSLAGESDDFIFNPFLDLPVFDLNTLAWLSEPNPNVEASETIPYVSVERTPTEIVSGTTLFGNAEAGVDYYSFSVTQGGSRGIFDIDGGFNNAPGNVNAQIFLFNRGTGEQLRQNSIVGQFDPGSQNTSGPLNFDPLIDITLDEPGVYLLGISAEVSIAGDNQLIQGNTLQPGDTYTLNVSLENQGTEGVALPVDPFNPDNYNPNLETRSGVLSESSGLGNGGTLTINTPELILNDSGTITSLTSDAGRSGNIFLNVPNSIEVRNVSSIENITEGSGNAGKIAIDTGRLQVFTGSISSRTTDRGNAGDIEILARESAILNGENAGGGIFSEVSGGTGDGGNITIDTPLLRVLNGFGISSTTLGAGNGGTIEIDADVVEVISDLEGGVRISDRGLPTLTGSNLLSISFGEGNGGSIDIETRQLRLLDGGNIIANAQRSGDAGDIVIRASEEVILESASSAILESAEAVIPEFIDLDRLFRSDLTIGAQISSTGDGGNLSIETGRLHLTRGTINASTRGAGNGGNVTVRATEVEIGRVSEFNASVDRFSTGDGGSILVEADRLRVVDGGQISAATVADGDAGNITLNVDALEVAGLSEDGDASQISALSQSDFAAGTIDIDTNTLTVRDGGEITVSSSGSGNAGNLNIDANSLFLDTNARLNADLQAGTQGNITLNTADLRLRRGSRITTNATGDATGGNINLDTETLVALENSDISANAEQSFGGQVNIAADGIFGTQFREVLTLESDITATSALGAEFSGAVQIQTPVVDPASGLVALDGDTLNPETQVRNACAAAVGNRFVLGGRGGFPEDPTQYLRGQTVWRDTRLGEIQSDLTPNPTDPAPDTSAIPTAPLVEATGWITNDRGQVELVVASGNPSHSSWQSHPECDSVSPESAPIESSVRSVTQ